MEIDTTVQFYYFSVHKKKLQEDNNLLDQLFEPLSLDEIPTSELAFGTDTSLGNESTVKIEDWKEQLKTISGAHSKDYSGRGFSNFYGNTGSIKVGIFLIYNNQGNNKEATMWRIIRTINELQFEITFRLVPDGTVHLSRNF